MRPYKPILIWVMLLLTVQNLISFLLTPVELDPILSRFPPALTIFFYVSLILSVLGLLVAFIFSPRLWAMLLNRIVATYLGIVLLGFTVGLLVRVGINPVPGFTLPLLLVQYFALISFGIALLFHAYFIHKEIKDRVEAVELLAEGNV